MLLTWTYTEQSVKPLHAVDREVVADDDFLHLDVGAEGEETPSEDLDVGLDVR